MFQGTPEKGIGLAYMMGSTGGYLAGFLVMAAIVGWAVDRGWGRNIVKIFAAMLVAEIVMMAMGFSWLAYLIGAAKVMAVRRRAVHRARPDQGGAGGCADRGGERWLAAARAEKPPLFGKSGAACVQPVPALCRGLMIFRARHVRSATPAFP